MAEKTIEELWPDFSNDLEKIKQECSKNWGYNNLYSRNFVNKAISMEHIFDESHLIKLFLSLLKLDTGYSTMTLIKCFIALKKKLYPCWPASRCVGAVVAATQRRGLWDQFRDKLIKKIEEYQHLNRLFINQMTKMRYRGLMTILAECREQI